MQKIREDSVTRTVEVLDILPGEPPRLLTGERLHRNGKPGRLFQQMVSVPDAELFARLTAQIGKGDTITITVTTEWYEEGFKAFLTGYNLLPSETPEGVNTLAESSV